MESENITRKPRETLRRRLFLYNAQQLYTMGVSNKYLAFLTGLNNTHMYKVVAGVSAVSCHTIAEMVDVFGEIHLTDKEGKIYKVTLAKKGDTFTGFLGELSKKITDLQLMIQNHMGQ